MPHAYAWTAGLVSGPDAHAARACGQAGLADKARYDGAGSVAERYRTDSSESYFISRGAWRRWGPEGDMADTEEQPGTPESSSRASQKEGVTTEQQRAETYACTPSTPISWGLYARSIADLQRRGELSTVAKGAGGCSSAGHGGATGMHAVTGHERA